MLYVLENGDPQSASDPSSVPTDRQRIEVTGIDRLREMQGLDMVRGLLEATYETSSSCQVELARDGLYGVLVIPDENDLLGTKIHVAFYLTANRLVMVDDTEFTCNTLDRLADLPLPPIEDVSECLAAFIDFTLDDDMNFLQDYERRMEELESQILADPDSTTNTELLNLRRELYAILMYYEALGDMVEYIEDSPEAVMPNQSRLRLKAVAHRADRLESHVQSLKEYSLNLRELYQSQIDLRTNRTMQILTIVTTIFMPLTVIGGWFGMNMIIPFTNSPALFGVVCAAAVLIVVVEVVFFKFKKWL